MITHNPDLTPSVIHGLGWLYMILFAMNVIWTIRIVRQDPHALGKASFWAVVSGLLFMTAVAHITGTNSPDHFLIRMPEGFKAFVNKNAANPVTYFLLTTILFVAILFFRKQFANVTVGWVILNLSALFLILSMTDYDFRLIVSKPDNVPIVAMLFIVGYFTWLYFRRAVDNDQRIAEGRPVFEAEDNEKVLVWPDLVYTELVCMVAVTAILVLWGIVLQAPLEDPASSVRTPNPSKAPWYFLGLQEMLVYYDPWMAGVVLPSLILVGLMAVPYFDFNTKGNGYYTFNERKFAITTFMFGFIPLWIGLIVLGTFLRGPNWNFFGIYEPWDAHKLEVLNNVNLSEYVWLDMLKSKLPMAPSGSSAGEQVFYILKRESVGLILTIAYLAILPPLMAATIFRKFFVKMGFIRYMVFANLLLFMAALPLKMILRWSFNLKYIVAIPEWFFNI